MTDRMTPIAMVELIADALQDVCDELVFIGGAITGLLITDSAAPPPSATKDVDVIVSVTTKTDYLGRLSDRMRALGFHEDTSEEPLICRWHWGDRLKLDLLPTDPTILGFANRWFADAFVHARPCTLPSGKSIRVVTAPYFLATKLEAFRSRGAGDYMGSKDIEDLAAVLHGREDVVTDVLAASTELRAYLSEHAAKLLGSRAFRQSLEGHLPGEDRTLVTQRLEQIVALPTALR
jgi:predicted nucleotidyltransferase